jgi:hypothetical protein
MACCEGDLNPVNNNVQSHIYQTHARMLLTPFFLTISWDRNNTSPKESPLVSGNFHLRQTYQNSHHKKVTLRRQRHYCISRVSTRKHTRFKRLACVVLRYVARVLVLESLAHRWIRRTVTERQSGFGRVTRQDFRIRLCCLLDSVKVSGRMDADPSSTLESDADTFSVEVADAPSQRLSM